MADYGLGLKCVVLRASISYLREVFRVLLGRYSVCIDLLSVRTLERSARLSFTD